MTDALIHIDYTYDFIADDGKLTCGEPGQLIYPAIYQLTQEFNERGDFIVFAIDGHDPHDTYHPEHRLFPPHNLIGSAGRRLYGDLEDYYQSIKDQDHVYYLDKTRYSAFAGTDLAIRLRERKIDTLHLVGVCTDICVLHTAVDAYNLGYQLVIHQDCTATFTPNGQEWALAHFKHALGATII